MDNAETAFAMTLMLDVTAAERDLLVSKISAVIGSKRDDESLVERLLRRGDEIENLCAGIPKLRRNPA